MGYHLDVMKEKNWGQKMVDHLVGCSVALSAKNLAALKDLTRVELKVAKRVLRKPDRWYGAPAITQNRHAYTRARVASA